MHFIWNKVFMRVNYNFQRLLYVYRYSKKLFENKIFKKVSLKPKYYFLQISKNYILSLFTKGQSCS